MLKSWLAHQLTKGLALDDPRTTFIRAEIIREKPFLRKLYEEWYKEIASALPPGNGALLELGSGPGFMQTVIPGLITSEVFWGSDVDLVMDGSQLPFADDSLRAIVMTDVFHHLSQPRSFLKEATRCVRTGGKVVMVEPWVSLWSRWVYQRWHHEPFRPDAPEWEFSPTGPLSGANGALPWIIFHRDRAQFEAEFPQWQIELIKPMMPFRYLVSGGVSLRGLQPSWSYGLWQRLEDALQPWMDKLAMFSLIVLQRNKMVISGKRKTSEESLLEGTE